MDKRLRLKTGKSFSGAYRFLTIKIQGPIIKLDDRSIYKGLIDTIQLNTSGSEVIKIHSLLEIDFFDPDSKKDDFQV